MNCTMAGISNILSDAALGMVGSDICAFGFLGTTAYLNEIPIANFLDSQPEVDGYSFKS
jgi:hypothetical protein